FAVLTSLLGNYAKNFIVKYNHSFGLAAGTALVASSFVIMSGNGFMAYDRTLKMGRLNNPVMAISVPVSCFMPKTYLSTALARCRARDAVGTVGRYSVVIMYLRLPVNIFFRTVLGYDVTTFEFTCFGVVIPVIIGMLMSRAGVTRRLLLGRDNRMPKTAG